MALLPQIDYGDIRGGLAAAGQGYALGQDMRTQNTLSQAGEALAGGNRKGAVNALYAGGQVEQGLKMEDHFRQQARQASADQLAKATRFNTILGNLAMSADTPEKWSAAIGAAKQAGMDVDKWADFGTRDYVLAQAGKTKEVLEMALKERQAAAKDSPFKVVSKGGRIFDERTQQFVEPEGGAADPELTLEQGKYEQGLRKEYTSLTSDLRVVSDSLGKLRTSAKTNTGAGDMAMVYSYMKMLDPTSVVREGEYATAENTGGVGEKIYGMYNRILSGQRLTPEQRNQFLQSAEALAADKVKRFQALRGQFENIAKKTGADPNRIMLDEGMAQTTPDEGAPPNEAVQMLRSDPTPERVQQFEEVFGPGSAQRALGR